MNKIRSLLSISLILIICGCHHEPIKTALPDDKTSYPQATSVGEGKYTGPSLEKVETEYSLLQLDAAANAYKTIFDETLASNGEKTAVDLFGCSVKADVAKKAMMPLKVLIDGRIDKERFSYLRSPRIYLKTRSVASCSTFCSCGVLSDMLSGVDVRTLKKDDLTKHEQLVLELQEKAAKQGPDASMACARKQTWLCGSDLQAYLEHASAQ
jgi:hypothetical protein